MATTVTTHVLQLWQGRTLPSSVPRTKKTQINSIIDEPEDMKGVQEALTPEGILDNALAMFDRMLDHMKDEFIQKYKGESQNFQGV
jgi:hypothetical protein